MLEIEAKKKFKIAQKNFENKNYKEAQRLWSEIVVYYPKNLSVLRNLSLAYFYDKNLYQKDKFYRATADTARRAVLDSSPLPLPKGKEKKFENFLFDFDPSFITNY